jgi:cytochrome c553
MRQFWMKGVLLVLLAVGVGVAHAADPFVNGDAEAGAAKAAVCAACHGPGGNSGNAEWPSLAGQSPVYTYRQLQAYKDGTRQNALMSPQAAGLSDQDMRDLAAYYAVQEARPGVASEDSVEIAQPLYRGGDAARGLPACAACHGPAGVGNLGAGYPRIASQHAEYTAAQLRAYRAGERGKGATGQMMQAAAKHLTDEEIDALASYVTGLQ